MTFNLRKWLTKKNDVICARFLKSDKKDLHNLNIINSQITRCSIVILINILIESNKFLCLFQDPERLTKNTFNMASFQLENICAYFPHTLWNISIICIVCSKGLAPAGIDFIVKSLPDLQMKLNAKRFTV